MDFSEWYVTHKGSILKELKNFNGIIYLVKLRL